MMEAAGIPSAAAVNDFMSGVGSFTAPCADPPATTTTPLTQGQVKERSYVDTKLKDTERDSKAVVCSSVIKSAFTLKVPGKRLKQQEEEDKMQRWQQRLDAEAVELVRAHEAAQHATQMKLLQLASTQVTSGVTPTRVLPPRSLPVEQTRRKDALEDTQTFVWNIEDPTANSTWAQDVSNVDPSSSKNVGGWMASSKPNAPQLLGHSSPFFMRVTRIVTSTLPLTESYNP